MKKVKQVFNGVVNGQTYATVEEYNAAIEEALKTNQPIHASTTTTTVEVDEEEETATTSEKALEDVKPVDFHDIKGLDFLPDVDLDKVDSPRKANIIVDKLEDMIYDDVELLLENGSDDLKRYLQELSVLDGKNKQKAKVTDDAITSLEDQLDEINNKLEVLYRTYDVVAGLDNFYSCMKDAVNEELESRKTVDSKFKKLLQDLGLK